MSMFYSGFLRLKKNPTHRRARYQRMCLRFIKPLSGVICVFLTAHRAFALDFSVPVIGQHVLASSNLYVGLEAGKVTNSTVAPWRQLNTAVASRLPNIRLSPVFSFGCSGARCQSNYLVNWSASILVSSTSFTTEMTRAPSQLPSAPFFSSSPDGLFTALDQLMVGQPNTWNALASGTSLQTGSPTPDLACRRQILAFTHPFTAGSSDFQAAQTAAITYSKALQTPANFQNKQLEVSPLIPYNKTTLVSLFFNVTGATAGMISPGVRLYSETNNAAFYQRAAEHIKLYEESAYPRVRLQSVAYQPTNMSKGQGIIVFETGFNVETLSGHLKAKRATLPTSATGQPTYQDLWTLEEKIARTDANALSRRILIARYATGQIASAQQMWLAENTDVYNALNLSTTPSATQLMQLRYLMGQSTNEVRRGGTLPSRLPASSDPQGAPSQLLGPIAMAKPLVLSPADNAGYVQTSWGGASYQAFLTEKSTRTPQLIVPTDGDLLHVIDLINQGDDATENYAFLPKFRYNDNWLSNAGDRKYRYAFAGKLTSSDTVNHLNGNRWTTVFGGGYGYGAKGMFVIDANPETPDDQKILLDTSLISDNDQGYIFGDVNYARMPDGFWYAIFGNGQANNNNSSCIYAVRLFDTQLMPSARSVKYCVGSTSGLGAPALIFDTNRTAIGAYAGDAQGSLWRFNFGLVSGTIDITSRLVYRVNQAPLSETGLAIIGQPLVLRTGAGYFVVYSAGSNYRDDRGVLLMIGLHDQGNAFSNSNPPVLKGIAGLDDCVALGNCNAYQVKTKDALVLANPTPFSLNSYDGWYLRQSGSYLNMTDAPMMIGSYMLAKTNSFDLQRPILKQNQNAGLCTRLEGAANTQSLFYLFNPLTLESADTSGTQDSAVFYDKNPSLANAAGVSLAGQASVTALSESNVMHLVDASGQKFATIAVMPKATKQRYTKTTRQLYR